MSDKLLKQRVGTSYKNMAITMFNVNHDTIPFKDIDPIPGYAIDHLDKSIRLFNEIENTIMSTGTRQGNVDNVLVPFWYSPNGSRPLFGSQKPFMGSPKAQELFKGLNIYSSEQMLARWSSSDICAALDSKLRYDEFGTQEPETLIGGGYESNHVDYCVSRGACIEVGQQTKEVCRYMTSYEMATGKTHVIFICGDNDFVNGSTSIFNKVNMYAEALSAHQTNDLRKGIDLAIENINTGTLAKDEADLNHVIKLNSSLAIVRLLSGACMLHDYLCLLKKYCGVNNLLSTRVDGNYNSVNINDVIDDFAKVKKYTVTARALSAIA